MQICNDITRKHGSYKQILGVTIDNKLSLNLVYEAYKELTIIRVFVFIFHGDQLGICLSTESQKERK